MIHDLDSVGDGGPVEPRDREHLPGCIAETGKCPECGLHLGEGICWNFDCKYDNPDGCNCDEIENARDRETGHDRYDEQTEREMDGR